MANAMTTTGGGKPLMKRSLSMMSKDHMAKVQKAYDDAMDGTDLPGELLVFKQGDYMIRGTKSKRSKKLEWIEIDVRDMEFMPNMANLMLMWRKFTTLESGKMRPDFGGVAFPLIDDDGVVSQLPDRSTLGDLDESKWTPYQGRPEDPWSKVAVLFLRDVSDDTLYRLEVSSVSAVNAVLRFMREFVEGYMSNEGLLPIIALDKESAERTADDGEVQRWKVPVIDILDGDWEAPTEAEEDLEVHVVVRSPEVTAAPALADETDAEEEEADEEKPKTRKKRTTAAASKSPIKRDEAEDAEVDDDDDSEAKADQDDGDGDGEEEVTVHGRGRKARRSTGKEAAKEAADTRADDEDEVKDEPEAPAKRRRRRTARSAE